MCCVQGNLSCQGWIQYFSNSGLLMVVCYSLVVVLGCQHSLGHQCLKIQWQKRQVPNDSDAHTVLLQAVPKHKENSRGLNGRQAETLLPSNYT